MIFNSPYCVLGMYLELIAVVIIIAVNKESPATGYGIDDLLRFSPGKAGQPQLLPSRTSRWMNVLLT